MHRIVRKIEEEKKAKSKLTEAAVVALSKMNKKKGSENLSFQIEIENDTQWENLLQKRGLLVVDIYSEWSGPCTSMVSILKRIKAETNEDKLVLAKANANLISHLRDFRDESEPTWFFLAGGQPINILWGADAPKLCLMIKEELKNEAQRLKTSSIPLKSINPAQEISKRKRSVRKAMLLANFINERNSAECDVDVSKSNQNLKSLNDLLLEVQNKTEGDYEIESCLLQLKKSINEYAILVIQNYLLETGAVSEIKDILQENFEVEQEQYVNFDSNMSRKIFSIPYEIPDPDWVEPTPSVTEDEATQGMLGEEASEAEESLAGDHLKTSRSRGRSKSKSRNPSEELSLHAPPMKQPSKRLSKDFGKSKGDSCSTPKENSVEPEVKSSSSKDVPEILKSQEYETKDTTEEADSDDETIKEEFKGHPFIPVELSRGVTGTTLLFLLKKNSYQENDKKTSANKILCTIVGPASFEEATSAHSKCLQAIYGRGAYEQGTWCPRKDTDVENVLITFFPRFAAKRLSQAGPIFECFLCAVPLVRKDDTTKFLRGLKMAVVGTLECSIDVDSAHTLLKIDPKSEDNISEENETVIIFRSDNDDENANLDPRVKELLSDDVCLLCVKTTDDEFEKKIYEVEKHCTYISPSKVHGWFESKIFVSELFRGNLF